jgi:hypothetical protein
MSDPLSADAFLAALRAEGLKVVEERDWRNHNRNSRGAWGPVNGVILHHTASSGEQSSVDLCYDGYSELPGPLCHSVIAKSGTVYMVGNGRANHAGGGDADVLNAVVNEDYGDYPPATDMHEGEYGAIDGNRRFYGAECINLGNGKDTWTPEQVDAMVRWSAAICRAHGWGAKSVIGHKEWSDYKPDPAGPGLPSMAVMRAKIAERLSHPASWNPSAPTVPSTGTTVTKPNRSVLKREENVSLLPDSPYTVYWTTEYPDDADGHGDGGKTVGTNITYNGRVNLTLSGLGHDQVVEVYAAEEDANGVLLGDSPVISQISGRELGFHPVRVSVPVNGTVSQRLVFKVVNRAPGTVVMEEAWLEMHSWPMV